MHDESEAKVAVHISEQRLAKSFVLKKKHFKLYGTPTTFAKPLLYQNQKNPLRLKGSQYTII